MDLTQKKCKPCEGGVPAMSEEQANELLKQVPSWKIKDWRVQKEFKFKNFIEAMEFVNKVADIAEQEQHHPDISISYSKVSIKTWTHAINGLSENDFIIVAKIDEISG
jgi:4a-hydroxytetrahydrobiopterin dehydratase